MKQYKFKDVPKHKWEEGQIKEHAYHKWEFQEGFNHHAKYYQGYFDHLKIDKDLEGKSVLEIGPANYPLLGYCHNLGGCYVIEPMDSPHLDRICEEKEITIIKEIAETAIFPEVDEIWLCNVLQHVINPNTIIEKCKQSANIIRYFEPIRTLIDPMHHWAFDLEYFISHFDKTSYYPKNMDELYFHKWECAYGIWRKTKQS